MNREIIINYNIDTIEVDGKSFNLPRHMGDVADILKAVVVYLNPEFTTLAVIEEGTREVETLYES